MNNQWSDWKTNRGVVCHESWTRTGLGRIFTPLLDQTRRSRRLAPLRRGRRRQMNADVKDGLAINNVQRDPQFPSPWMNHEVSFFLSALLYSTTSVAVLVAARKETRKDVASLTLIIFGRQSLVKRRTTRANDETEEALVQRRNNRCLMSIYRMRVRWWEQRRGEAHEAQANETGYIRADTSEK